MKSCTDGVLTALTMVRPAAAKDRQRTGGASTSANEKNCHKQHPLREGTVQLMVVRGGDRPDAAAVAAVNPQYPSRINYACRPVGELWLLLLLVVVVVIIVDQQFKLRLAAVRQLALAAPLNCTAVQSAVRQFRSGPEPPGARCRWLLPPGSSATRLNCARRCNRQVDKLMCTFPKHGIWQQSRLLGVGSVR